MNDYNDEVRRAKILAREIQTRQGFDLTRALTIVFGLFSRNRVHRHNVRMYVLGYVLALVTIAVVFMLL